MIAPLRQTGVNPDQRKLLRARMAVADALLPRRKTASGPLIARPQAWLWAVWVVVIAMFCVVRIGRTFLGR